MPELKKVKDFSDEEKAAILARAEKIEVARVAKEFNTTWQVVSAIQRKAKNTKLKNAKSQKSKAANAKAPSSKTPHSSNVEKRLAILKRASEIGVIAAAAEAGVSKWIVFQWRKIMKKQGYDIPRAARVRTNSKAAVATKAAKTSRTPKVANKTTAPATSITRVKATGSYSSLELENEMLKQKIADLTAQVSKLRAALSALA
ncbi:MAG: hypothetical protein IJ597_03740 [Synergistaceae bacterium]|nr:hypothetical protein [Synergistaceae bacterium]